MNTGGDAADAARGGLSRHLAVIERIAGALSGALTPAQIADVVITEAVAGLGAGGGVVGLLSAAGIVQVIAATGIDAETPMKECVETGEPVWDEGAAAVPLVADGRVIGALAISFRDNGDSEADRRFLSAVGGFAAQAIARARMLERERIDREAAEEAVIRLGRLQAITVGLSEALHASEVAAVVVGQGLAELGASGGSLALVTADGTQLEIVSSFGYEPSVSEQWHRFDINMEVPAAEALCEARVVTFSSIEERDRRWPLFRGTPTPNRAFAVVPLIIESRPVGVLSLSFADDRTFSVADHAFLEAIGRQCALALERARLYEAERAAHGRAELAAEQLAFLAEASEVLASSLDVGTTLARMVNVVVPELADSCSVHMFRNGRLEPVAMANAIPEREPTMWALAEDDATVPDTMLMRVAATGETVLATEVDHSVLLGIGRDDDHRQLLEQLGIRSAAIVGLRARDRSVGVLSLTMTDSSHRTLTDADLPLINELARRAAVAIDNASLYAERSEIAQTLQRSLLPRRPPQVPGLDVAARFRAGADGTMVGGDFYDAFEDGAGRWCVVVGDVCGRGAEAAALTSLVRYSMRALASSVPEPGELLRRVNSTLLAEETGDRFCTIAYAAFTIGTGTAAVSIAAAGHPPPIVVRSSGDVVPIVAAGTLLGALDDAAPGLAEVVLETGDALVLYTDGVTEARRGDTLFGEERLRGWLATVTGQSADEMAEAVVSAAAGFNDQSGDDIAVVVVRVS